MQVIERLGARLGAAVVLAMLATSAYAAAAPDACPPAQGQFAPIDAEPHDVDDLRPGMTLAAAQAMFGCVKDGYQVRMVKRGPPQTAAPHLVLTAANASRQYTLFLAGVPGDERVIRVEKQQTFRGADAPSRQQVTDQLTAKYGRFTPLPELFQTEINTAGMIAKGYGPTAVSPGAEKWPMLCHNAASGGAVSPRMVDCGVTIDYRLDHRRAPEAVVWRLTLVSMDVRAASRQVILAANSVPAPAVTPASGPVVVPPPPTPRLMTVRAR